MKIMMIAPEPIFEPRGTPFSVMGRLKALSDMGHRVDLLTYPMGDDIFLPGVRIIRIFRVPGIRKVKIGPSWSKIPLDFGLLINSLILILTRKYDLIHSHEEAGIWSVILSRMFHIPHIYDMHSSLPQQFKNFEYTNNRLVILLFQSFEKWVLKYASSIITICRDLYDYVKRLQPDRGSILIENTIDYGMIFGRQNRSSQIKHRLKLAGKQIILYTGTFEAYQGLDLLIASIRYVIQENKSVVFLMVGGQPDQVAYYKKFAIEKNVMNYILFTGQVNPKDIESYIDFADVLVSPRISGTNTPLKIYSYLRSGHPIVATRLLTHTQVLNEEIALLTQPTPESLGQNILRVLNSQSLADRIGRHAKNYALKNYSYTVYLEQFEKAIQLAMERGA